MPKKMICPKCKALFDSGNFCSQCGGKLAINPAWQAEEDKRLKQEQEQKKKEAANEKTMLSIINTYRPFKNTIMKAINEFFNNYYGDGEELNKLCNYIARFDKGEKDSLLIWYNEYCTSRYSKTLKSKADKVLRYLTFLPDGKDEIVRELEERVHKIKDQYSYYELNTFFKNERLKNIKIRSQNYKAQELVELYSGALIDNEIMKAFLDGGTFSVDTEMVERCKDSPSRISYIYYYDVTCTKYKYSKGVLDRIKYDIDYEFDDEKAGLEALRIALELEDFEKCVVCINSARNVSYSYGDLLARNYFTQESNGFHILTFEHKRAFKGAKIIETSVHSGGEHY